MDGDLLNIKRIKYVNVSFIPKIKTKALVTWRICRAFHYSRSRPQILILKQLRNREIKNVRVGKITYNIVIIF